MFAQLKLKTGLFARLAAILLVVLTVTGCTAAPPSTTDNPGTDINNGGNNGNNSGGNGGNDNGNTQKVIDWWGAFLQPSDVQPLIERFESENPGIKVNYQLQLTSAQTSDVDSYRTKLEDIVPDGNNPNNPDIYMIDSGWMGVFIPYAAPAPSDVISTTSYKSAFYDFVTTDMVRKDQIYGLPLWVDTLAIIYNKSMWGAEGLSQPDSDWNRFANDQVKKLTKKNTVGKITQAGFSGAITKNTEFWFEALNMFMLQNRTQMISDVDQLTFADGGEAKPAVDFYKQFNSTNKSWENTFNVDVAAFLEKKLATYMAPSWRLNDIVRYNTAAGLNINVGTAEVPQLKSTIADKTNFAFYWTNVVNSQSTSSPEAWRFLNYITQPSQLQLLNTTIKQNQSSAIGLLFPRKDMNSQQINDTNLGVYARSLNTAKSWFMLDEEIVKLGFSKVLDSSSDLKRTQTEINTNLANTKTKLGTK